MTTPPPIDAPNPSEDDSPQGESETQHFQKQPFSPRPQVSSAKFVDSVVALDLATRKQIEKVVSELPEEKRDSTHEIARSLVKSRVLSKMQSENIANGKGELLKVGEDYVILESIGKGGMGEVFKALHRTMAREVAIKFVAMQVANDPETLARFQREVRAAAKLIHPNIVTAFDAGVDRKRPYLVMECVSGKDLAKAENTKESEHKGTQHFFGRYRRSCHSFVRQHATSCRCSDRVFTKKGFHLLNRAALNTLGLERAKRRFEFTHRNELIAADVESASRLETASLLDADWFASDVLECPAKILGHS